MTSLRHRRNQLVRTVPSPSDLGAQFFFFFYFTHSDLNSQNSGNHSTPISLELLKIFIKCLLKYHVTDKRKAEKKVAYPQPHTRAYHYWSRNGTLGLRVPGLVLLCLFGVICPPHPTPRLSACLLTKPFFFISQSRLEPRAARRTFPTSPLDLCTHLR